VNEVDEIIKIVIAGLDNAGKTSILTALDKKYDFQKDIVELAPTIRVEYQTSSFLTNNVVWWDMGGQEKYRKLYENKQDIYFAGTDLLLYIIDIQDEGRYETSLGYLDMILQNFQKQKMDVPLIISFHKFDPELRDEENLIENIEELKTRISLKYKAFKILFQQTSIYDIISIVQLISYGLSVFDEQFFDLSDMLEAYVGVFDCKSLIVLDSNGIIIGEFYHDTIDPSIYVELIESIKEHLFLLKRMQEEHYEINESFSSVGHMLLSYLHKIQVGNIPFFISVVINQDLKERLLAKFSDFLDELVEMLKPLVEQST
jgi:small GTP-binding protein